VNGVSVATSYGQMARAYAGRNVSLSFAKEIKDFSFVGHTFLGQGNRSDRDYTDSFGSTFNLKGNGDLDPLNMIFGLAYKGLSTRLIVDRFHQTTRDLYDEAVSQP
jgi:hypothetical protein